MWAFSHQNSAELLINIIKKLHFNSHFPGEPGSAGVYLSKGWWRWWRQLDNWSCKSCKAPVKSSPPTNQHPVFFTGRMPFLSPNQQCQSTEGMLINIITEHKYMLCASAVFAVARCLSVRPSVTFVHSIQTVEDIVKLLCRHGSPIILVFWPPALVPNFKGNPFSRGANHTSGGKILLRFLTKIAIYLRNSTR